MDDQHYNDFRNAIERNGFLDLPLKDYYQMIRDTSLEKLVVSQRKEFGKDQVKYDLGFHKGAQDNLPCFSGYTATMKHVPSIVYGNFEGIDTAVLEEKLKALNWDTVIKDYRQDPQNNGFMATFQEAYDQLAKLRDTRHPDAINISNGLMANYWLNTAIEKYIDLSYVRDVYERKHTFSMGNEYSDISAREAYHLLSGRAVLKFEQTAEHRFNDYWKQLDGWGVERNYPGFDLGGVLRGISVKEMATDQDGIPLIASLVAGELTPATITGDKKPVEVMLQADPKNQTVMILGKDRKPLAAELLPAVYKKEEPKELPSLKLQAVKPKPGRNKGRSL